jgi:hypothetical protein
MNCHVQDREDARLSERVNIGHSGGIGGDLIPSRDFVGRSLLAATLASSAAPTIAIV